jgi:hypothetical protein
MNDIAGSFVSPIMNGGSLYILQIIEIPIREDDREELPLQLNSGAVRSIFGDNAHQHLAVF